MFSPDSSCPLILWILFSRFRFRLRVFHPLRLTFPCHSANFHSIITVRTPAVLLQLVWPIPLSLATTHGISVDFSSSRYLDVSVPGVPHADLWIQSTLHDSSPCVFPHSEICGYNAYLQLTAAYRSLSRPSSAPDAKAFTLRSCSLELLAEIDLHLSLPWFSSELYEFLLNITFKDTCLQCKRFPFHVCSSSRMNFHLSVKLYFSLLRLERL